MTIIPTKIIGPIKIIDPNFTAEVKVPLATFETPLWFSVSRGARVTRNSGGIKTVVVPLTLLLILKTKRRNLHKLLLLVADLRA